MPKRSKAETLARVKCRVFGHQFKSETDVHEFCTNGCGLMWSEACDLYTVSNPTMPADRHLTFHIPYVTQTWR